MLLDVLCPLISMRAMRKRDVKCWLNILSHFMLIYNEHRKLTRISQMGLLNYMANYSAIYELVIWFFSRSSPKAGRELQIVSDTRRMLEDEGGSPLA